LPGTPVHQGLSAGFSQELKKKGPEAVQAMEEAFGKTFWILQLDSCLGNFMTSFLPHPSGMLQIIGPLNLDKSEHTK
jgi:hypothetical protein